MDFSHLAGYDSQIMELCQKEDERQQNELELIASENYASLAVREAMMSSFCNKYSEGYPGRRYYAGQEFVDDMENLAINRAKELFGCEHANVQPLSGGPANLAVYLGLLQPGDTVLGFDLAHGGHLSHGHLMNFSGKLYNIVPYGVDAQTYEVDMDEVERLAHEHKPQMILAGFSAYPRDFDWQRFRKIADDVGAYLMADIAHIAGLIAGKAIENPVPYCDVVTTTTHKTLRGPRGALVMCKEDLAKTVDCAVFPGIQGGPHEHIIVAKAVAFKEALEPSFQDYASKVIRNAQALATALMDHGYHVLTNGTDNHIVLLDTFSQGIGGKDAEKVLEQVGLSVNKNMIPFDTRKPMDPSGVRLGNAAATTRGLWETEMQQIARIMDEAMQNINDKTKLQSLKNEVKDLLSTYPLPG